MRAGTKLLIKAIDNCDLIWVLIWGGSNALAQALLEVQNTRSQAEIELFTCKIRVYAISDQDELVPRFDYTFRKLSTSPVSTHLTAVA